jgi:NADH-quinone oxidoreductase subunit C
LVDWRIGGLADWWIGGLADWWIGGLVDWWIGGLVDAAFSVRFGGRSTNPASHQSGDVWVCSVTAEAGVTMEALEEIQARLATAVPGARIEIVPNASAADQRSLRVDPAHAVATGTWLRDDPDLQLDYASNVTGVDWLDKVIKSTVKSKRVVGGQEVVVDEIVERVEPGYLEVVYHLYSMSRKQGPVILRQRTQNRSDQVQVASLTSVWRGAEFQEREVFDLYGVVFEGHPDLRRILMWDGFEDYPMRKDYVEPDDYEYEPTPHGTVLEKARRHYPAEKAP